MDFKFYANRLILSVFTSRYKNIRHSDQEGGLAPHWPEQPRSYIFKLVR